MAAVAPATGAADDSVVRPDEDDEGEEGEEGDKGDATADEGAGDDEGEATGGKKKKSSARRRRNASELNLLRDPADIIVELTEVELQRLSKVRKLHQLRYPTYIVCTHENFQLRDISGLQAIKGTALKELDLSHNKLMVIDALEQVCAAAQRRTCEAMLRALGLMDQLSLLAGRLSSRRSRR